MHEAIISFLFPWLWSEKKYSKLTTFRARLSVPYAIKQVKPRNQRVNSDAVLESLSNHTLTKSSNYMVQHPASKIYPSLGLVPDPLPQHWHLSPDRKSIGNIRTLNVVLGYTCTTDYSLILGIFFLERNEFSWHLTSNLLPSFSALQQRLLEGAPRDSYCVNKKPPVGRSCDFVCTCKLLEFFRAWAPTWVLISRSAALLSSLLQDILSGDGDSGFDYKN